MGFEEHPCARFSHSFLHHLTSLRPSLPVMPRPTCHSFSTPSCPLSSSLPHPSLLTSHFTLHTSYFILHTPPHLLSFPLLFLLSICTLQLPAQIVVGGDVPWSVPGRVPAHTALNNIGGRVQRQAFQVPECGICAHDDLRKPGIVSPGTNGGWHLSPYI